MLTLLTLSLTYPNVHLHSVPSTSTSTATASFDDYCPNSHPKPNHHPHAHPLPDLTILPASRHQTLNNKSHLHRQPNLNVLSPLPEIVTESVNARALIFDHEMEADPFNEEPQGDQEETVVINVNGDEAEDEEDDSLSLDGATDELRCFLSGGRSGQAGGTNSNRHLGAIPLVGGEEFATAQRVRSRRRQLQAGGNCGAAEEGGGGWFAG